MNNSDPSSATPTHPLPPAAYDYSRETALDLAIKAQAQNSNLDILKTAETFYTFLKGGTK